MMSCGSGLTECGSACVDLASSEDHCGDCNNSCNSDQECRGGGCRCSEGLSECDGACIDVNVDVNNCGLCGRVCAADEDCRAGSCRVTRETECLDGMDDDGDSLTDCEDPDCAGTERECSCPDGLVGMGMQLCVSGTGWSDCLGCEAPPECTDSSECGTGYECVGGMCRFDLDSRWDIYLIDGNIPTRNYSGTAWDAWGGQPDAQVRMRVGSSSEDLQMSTTQDDTTSPTWMETVILNRTARDILSHFYVAVYEVDSGWDITGWDNVGACLISLAPASFDGADRAINCPRSSTYETPGWRLRVRIDPVTGIGS